MILRVDVELVSPAIIGGAGQESGKQQENLDYSKVLRPPAIRGHLRFWARALTAGAGGAGRLETELFGAIERGQRTVVLPAVGEAVREETGPLFPGKDGKYRSETRRISVGARYRLRFRLPADVDSERFAAVLWTWLHLGTIGRRSRRGYGALLWRPRDGDALEGFPRLEHATDLASQEDLEDYLRRGLAVVESRLGAPSLGASPRSSNDWYRLRVQDQVFVGGPIRDARYNGAREGMEDLLHGLDGPDPGEARELGKGGSDRLASPLMWRPFPATGGGYFVVAVWSPVSVLQFAPDSTIGGYLTKRLHLSRSLDDTNIATPIAKSPPPAPEPPSGS